MNEKIIVGFIGDYEAGKTTAACVLEELGFYRLSIDQKVQEFAVQLLDEEATDTNTIMAVRQKGYGVNRGYWLNLVLMSVPDIEDYMVIDDISEEDMIRNVVVPYHIVRSDSISAEDVIEGATVIFNNTTLEDFEDNVRAIFSPLIKK